ncbi:MAG TPA: hypothetical protein VGB98_24875, partial [Pyrinomonadaceae bacterium]
VGWFVTALVACALLGARGRRNFWAAFVGVAIVLFFALCALSYSLFAVALVGFALCAARLAPRSSRRGVRPTLTGAWNSGIPPVYLDPGRRRDSPLPHERQAGNQKHTCRP